MEAGTLSWVSLLCSCPEMIVLKAELKLIGAHRSSDLLKIFVKTGASWSAQFLRQEGDTPFGSGIFFTL